MKTKKQFIIPAILVALIAPKSFANFVNPTQEAVKFAQCQYIFKDKKSPLITKKTAYNQNLISYCYDGFAVKYSLNSKTPLWSAELLTPNRIKLASELERVDSFHEEVRLPERYRANNQDYRGSGYDRGHLAPNADMKDVNQQHDSFALTNIIPQTPRNNRDVWRSIESATRRMVYKKGAAYVVTGVVFNGEVKKIGQGVHIPSSVYKAVYFPTTGEAGVYISENNDLHQYRLISLNELNSLAGIDIFPNLSQKVKSRTGDFLLPEIEEQGTPFLTQAKKEISQQVSKPSFWVSLIKKIINIFI